MKILILFLLLTSFIELSIQTDFKDEYVDCSGKGIYLDKLNDCKCLPGFETYPKNSNIKCNYELRSKRIALFCSIFGGMLGADMIYLGYTMKGIFKSFFPMCVTIFLLRIQNNKAWKSIKFSYYLSMLPVVLYLFLWIADVIQILNGNIKDANGFNLND
jgi:hypothetical protein